MLREIMVPLDGTKFAEAALPHALGLARRDGARVRLVTVWRPLPPPESKSSWERERRAWQDEDRDRLAGYLRDLASAAATAAGVSVDTEVLEGGVDHVLPRWTARSTVDLVVMATHARTPAVRAWLGSAGDHMVREGRHPVLLIHPEHEEPEVTPAPSPPARTIVVPLDGSELAELALDAAVLGGAAAADVKLALLRVAVHATTAVPAYAPGAEALNEASLESLRSEAEEYLARVSARMADWAGEVETHVIMDGAVARAITTFAEERGADLIAMGTRGRGGIARAVLGSVADKVMRTSEVPVLLFPPRGGDGVK